MNTAVKIVTTPKGTFEHHFCGCDSNGEAIYEYDTVVNEDGTEFTAFTWGVASDADGDDCRIGCDYTEFTLKEDNQ